MHCVNMVWGKPLLHLHTRISCASCNLSALSTLSPPAIFSDNNICATTPQVPKQQRIPYSAPGVAPHDLLQRVCQSACQTLDCITACMRILRLYIRWGLACPCYHYQCAWALPERISYSQFDLSVYIHNVTSLKPSPCVNQRKMQVRMALADTSFRNPTATCHT